MPVLDRVRDWGRAKLPLGEPSIAEIRVRGALDAFGAAHLPSQVDMPLITMPGLAPRIPLLLDLSIAERLPLLDVSGVSLDLSELDHPDTHVPFEITIPFPKTRELGDDHSLPFPAVLSLLEPLQVPGRAGKAYTGVQSPDGQNEQPALPDLNASPTNADQQRCIHGLPRYSCALCRRAKAPTRSTQSPTKPRTLDVFDLLLPYLQPPLEPLLSQPLFFPANRRPYPYQIYGIKFLAERTGALLGDEMGLGKTIQAIVALQLLFRRGEIRHVLVLCPRSLLGTWERELGKWAQELYVVRVRGTPDERKALWQSNTPVFLTTYETFRQDLNRGLAIRNRFDVAVLDEVQKIKNPSAGVTQAVRKLNARYRWGLSGTPLENNIDEVVAIFDYLSPQLFRGNAPLLGPMGVRDRIEPSFLRRRARDVLPELPEMKSEQVWLELTPEQRRTYEAIESRGREKLSTAEATRIHVFALINELKQICNLDRRTRSSCKLEYLADHLEGITENDYKALVFSQFPHVTLKQIEPSMARFDPAVFDGSLGDSQREMLLGAFERETEPKVLLVSLKTGGVGLNLTRANYVFHFDHWWNPATARQAEKRAHRPGQKNTVFVYDIFTMNTIEERIFNLLEQKQHLFDLVIDDLSDKAAMRTLTDEDLFGLFGLKPPSKTETPEPDRKSGAHRVAQLSELDPQGFEQLVAALYRAMGFTVQVTTHTRDGGVDVVARGMGRAGEEHIIIQCKHYPGGLVGPQYVRELIGTWEEHRQATRAVLVTSGRFSDEAIRLADKHRIQLYDGKDLSRLVAQHNLG